MAVMVLYIFVRGSAIGIAGGGSDAYGAVPGFYMGMLIVIGSFAGLFVVPLGAKHPSDDKTVICLALIHIIISAVAIFFVFGISVFLISVPAGITSVICIIEIIKRLRNLKKEGNMGLKEGDGWKFIYALRKILLPTVFVALAMLMGYVIKGNMDQAQLNAGIASNFDSFVMKDLDGNEYNENLFKESRITMVNVWGTFCGPCIAEMPDLQEVYEHYDRSEFNIVGLTCDLYTNGALDEAQIEAARKIVQSTGVKYPILIPSQGIQTGVISGIQAVPTTIFINSKGETVKSVMGSRDKETWIKLIEEVLANER